MPAAQKPQDAARIQSLDGLRAVSILLVIYGHARVTYGFPGADPAESPLARLDVAHFGVKVFFVISGFLITSLLIGELRKTGTVSLGAFYLKRTFRIFPPYYFYLLVALGISALGMGELPWSDALLAFTYTINYSHDRAWLVGHAWSLSIEEQFYLVWPAVFRGLGTKKGPAAVLWVMALAPLLRVGWAYFVETKAGRDMIDEAFPTVADSIGTGCALALFRPRLHASERYLKVLASPVVPALAVGMIWLALWLDMRHAWVQWAIGETGLNLTIAILVDRYVRYPDGPVGRVLNFRPVAFIGMVSYSLYLWQQPFLRGIEAGKVPPWWQQFPVNVGLSFVVAVGSYYLIEKPFLRLRGRVMGEGKRAKEGQLQARGFTS
ncbi:MAG: acyltransferase [Polyangiaceae bacterium]